jgi:hypothetical protein
LNDERDGALDQENLRKKKARNEAIADAFDCVDGVYTDNWIEVANWFRIICTEQIGFTS